MIAIISPDARIRQEAVMTEKQRELPMTRNGLIFAGLVAGATGVSGFAWAQGQPDSTDHNTMDHSSMMSAETSGAPVSEPGQGAFAAIAEIVAQLESDPHTDWNTVDIRGLREHLRDMDLVTIDAVAEAEEIDGGMRFTVTGTADVAPSIRRMTLAHADVMGGINDWKYEAQEIDDGAMITVMVPPQDMAKIKALGFFGMMASGTHHQEHHWMMASGQNPHG
jgi:hypothetical protein